MNRSVIAGVLALATSSLTTACNQKTAVATLEAEGAVIAVNRSEAALAAIEESLSALRTRELVKVMLNKTAGVSAKAAAHELAESVGAEVIQTIGKTATLYRRNPEKEKPIELP